MALRNIVIVLVVVALSGLADGATVTLTAVADTDIRQAVPWYAKGNRTAHVCQNSLAYPSRNSKIYVRFDLPADFDTAVSATFKITNSAVYNSLWFWKYNVHGLNDGAVGNDWQDLSPGTIPDGSSYSLGLTWGNAPANDQSNGTGFTGDATGVLGSFNEQNVGVENQVSTTELVDFLNTDTDGLITLMIAREHNSSAGSAFASRENSQYARPQLELTYTPIPEPITLALLAVGGLLTRRRK